MNAQQLRNSILQEAICGRLVPQDPNDEPASALLNRIREEKKQLVKAGKLKKKDLEETPISEDEKPFDIPDSWEWRRVNNIGEIITGGTPPKSETKYYGNDYPFYKPADLEQGINTINSLDSLSEDGFNHSRKLPKDSILVTCIGSIGKTGLIRKEGTCNQQINAIIPNILLIIPEYLYYCCLSPCFQESMWGNSSSTTLAILNKNKFSQLLIPLPPLAEQKRIVAKIEELLPKVEEYGKAQEELDKLNEELPERLKKSVLQEAISGELVPQDPNDEPASVLLNRIREEKKRLVKEGKLKKKDLEETPISEDEIPFDIPDSWEWVRLADVFEHSSGKQLRASDTEGTLHEYITTSNLYWGRFELNKLKSMYYKDSEIEKCTAKKGDLLVCEGGDIGRSAIWSYDYDICLQNHVHRLRPYDSRYTIFVFYIMWYYKSVGLIGGKGIGIQGLSASALKTIIIPLPPLAEQRRIVAKIEEAFKAIDALS